MVIAARLVRHSKRKTTMATKTARSGAYALTAAALLASTATFAASPLPATPAFHPVAPVLRPVVAPAPVRLAPAVVTKPVSMVVHVAPMIPTRTSIKIAPVVTTKLTTPVARSVKRIPALTPIRQIVTPMQPIKGTLVTSSIPKKVSQHPTTPNPVKANAPGAPAPNPVVVKADQQDVANAEANLKQATAQSNADSAKYNADMKALKAAEAQVDADNALKATAARNGEKVYGGDSAGDGKRYQQALTRLDKDAAAKQADAAKISNIKTNVEIDQFLLQQAEHPQPSQPVNIH